MPAEWGSWKDREGQTWRKGVCCSSGLPFPWILCAQPVVKPQGYPEMSTSMVPTGSQLHIADSSGHPAAPAAHHTWPNTASQVVIACGPQIAEENMDQFLSSDMVEVLTFRSWPWKTGGRERCQGIVSNFLHQQSSFHSPYIWKWSESTNKEPKR